MVPDGGLLVVVVLAIVMEIMEQVVLGMVLLRQLVVHLLEQVEELVVLETLLDTQHKTPVVVVEEMEMMVAVEVNLARVVMVVLVLSSLHIPLLDK